MYKKYFTLTILSLIILASLVYVMSGILGEESKAVNKKMKTDFNKLQPDTASPGNQPFPLTDSTR